MRDSITTLINGIKAWIRGLLAGKLDKPPGGKDGDVLTKSGSSAAWGGVADAVKRDFPGGVGYKTKRVIDLKYSGNPDDYEIVIFQDSGEEFHFALIDNDVYAPEDIIGGCFTCVFEGQEMSIPYITEDDLDVVDGVMLLDLYFIVATEAGASLAGLTFPKVGIYALCKITEDGAEVPVTDWSFSNHTGYKASKIDAEYLPDFVKRYRFGRYAPADMMLKAVEEFREGRALISWNGSYVISAEQVVDNDTPEVYLIFSDNPTRRLRYQAVEDGCFYSDLGEGSLFDLYANYVRLSSRSIGDSYICYREKTSNGRDAYIEVGGAHLYSNAIAFRVLDPDSSSNSRVKITVDKSGVPTVYDEHRGDKLWTPADLPPVTAADNGKVLMVVDGKWVAAVAPTPQAVPEVTNNV